MPAGGGFASLGPVNVRDQLDKFMVQFRAPTPGFYAGYQSARVVVDLHGSGEHQTPTLAGP